MNRAATECGRNLPRTRAAAAGSRRGRSPLFTLAGTWTLLWAASAVPLPSGPRTLVAFAAATLWVQARHPLRASSREWLGLALGWGAGVVLLPAVVQATARAGWALGWPEARPHAPFRADPWGWASEGLLAPWFEESLYRGALLSGLRTRCGAALAVVLSSAAFAGSHLELGSATAAGLVGLGLGGVCVAARSIWVGVGVHAGLNAASLACGLPPVHAALPSDRAAWVGGALLLLAIAWVRRGARRPAA
ncbi:MAG: CPBP family intramembrane metalloprotease [Proteobacteria bacterium]|nr:CPBP family intramembrane metalloprotease [Pseudomonadota bacterium]